MSDSQKPSNFGLLLLAGIGAGALSGTLLGLVIARRPQAQNGDVFTDTVEDLKRRAEKILDELSLSASASSNLP